MKTIEINFVDFWPSFNKKDNIIINILNKKYNVIISENPKYVFCSLFGKEHLKYNDAVKILVIGENLAPDFNLYDYAIGFYNMKYKDRYLKYNILIEENIVKMLDNRNNNVKDKKFCAFVYTNGSMNPMRKNIFKKLNEYKKVESGGWYLNNIGFNIGSKKKDKLDFQKKYKFIIACENQQYPEYNTEKLIEAFASGGIPIYWGDSNISEIYNEKAFINCMKYNSLDEVKQKVIELDNDDDKYKKMMKEPVFNSNFNFYEETKKLEKFLYNIFDKDYKKAKRIRLDDGYFGFRYYKEYFPSQIYLMEKNIFKKIFFKLKKCMNKILKK